ncbi:hypothetical protein MTBBW1_1850012 [Desulfamplus magnetovallimortis]|uniref:Uncharacterized protein n=1 Tax=Desulfamplus magnetovallimortis TaxID=1246637 RepID=A0A1W1HAK4_9BACT|nr:hypothetical protein MTBBW1_1850012 [Desulfamplus magnetovallimortis]
MFWNLSSLLITYMADARHNRRDESRFKNSYLLRLSYKTPMFVDASQRNMKIVLYQQVKETF